MEKSIKTSILRFFPWFSQHLGGVSHIVFLTSSDSAASKRLIAAVAVGLLHSFRFPWKLVIQSLALKHRNDYE